MRGRPTELLTGELDMTGDVLMLAMAAGRLIQRQGDDDEIRVGRGGLEVVAVLRELRLSRPVEPKKLICHFGHFPLKIFGGCHIDYRS